MKYVAPIPAEADASVQIKSFLRRTRVAGAAVVAALQLFTTPSANSSDYLSRPEVRSFIDAMRADHGIDTAEVERVLVAVRHQPTVVRLIGPEPTAVRQTVRSYPAYRAQFLTPARIAAGTRYWELHEKHLRRAELHFGVPAEVILGILGVETAFGRNTGSFRVVDALATIAFDGPRRQEYFREELKELLLLAREKGIDPLAIKGSYAGAVGLPQFMPSSYRRHAVDFDGDGAVDLSGSPADAIGSIASYFKAYGWTTGEPPTAPVHLPSGAEAELVSGLQRVHEVTQLKQQGVRFQPATLPEGLCSVVELPAPGKPSRYVAGFSNFEVVTRYNRSTFYATAVLELADAIRKARDGELAMASRTEATRVAATSLVAPRALGWATARSLR
jgi:membrane-bound lytic murein transglycosylase B